VSDYRVTVKVRDYRGSDPKKRQKWYEEANLARRIEEYLQPIYDAVAPGGVETVFSYSVARKLDADPEKVRLLMCSIQGGSNGVTFMKPDSNGDYMTLR
jgi:hypothetical protein